jgi:hypothetical protein
MTFPHERERQSQGYCSCAIKAAALYERPKVKNAAKLAAVALCNSQVHFVRGAPR